MIKINATIEDILRTTTVGDTKSAAGRAFLGINHRLTPGAIPINRDYHGLILFSRPQLNLTDQNVRALRKLTPLLTTNEVSIQRIVRKLLDPRLAYNDNPIGCPFVDDHNAFIPLLTNHALSASGFPDPYVQTYVSKPGQRKETFGFIDDAVEKYQQYDVSVSFRNMVGDPISFLFDVWLEYAAGVFSGELLPYPDFIAANEVDYNTRIWRLVLDKNKRFVTKIGATGASYPVNTTLGAAFDFNHDRPLNSNSDTINIRFQSFGAIYNDPLLVFDFNRLVGYFNPAMREDSQTGAISKTMVQIPFGELEWFNNLGYPRIDPNTMELQWYLPKDQYNYYKRALTRTNNAITAG